MLERSTRHHVPSSQSDAEPGLSAIQAESGDTQGIANADRYIALYSISDVLNDLDDHTCQQASVTKVIDTYTPSIPTSNMTRTQKANARDHAGLADGTAAPEEHNPRYFTKHGHVGAAPDKVKKEGGGKANWGTPGDEAHDHKEFSFTASHHRNNSSTHGHAFSDFKTKFEMSEDYPVFVEEVHGAKHNDLDGGEVDKTDSASSAGSAEDSVSGRSVEE